MGIYRYEKRLWLAKDGEHGIKQSKEIIEENKKILIDYAKYLKATKRSLPRQDKLMRTLKTLATFLDKIPFNNVLCFSSA